MEKYIESLDNILTSIREPTLTDNEVAIISPVDINNNQEKYQILNKIIQNRGGDPNAYKKLRAKALLENIEINKPKKDFNNILFCFGVDNINSIKENETIEINYPFIKKVKQNDYLYFLEYNGVNYKKGIEYYNNLTNKNNSGCSVLRTNNYIGRNFDNVYTDLVEFVIFNNGNQYKSLSIGSIEGLNKDIVNSDKNKIEYEIVPMGVMDGLNEKCVFCFSCVVPNGDVKTIGTNPNMKKLSGLCIPRIIIDNFEDIETAINFLKIHYNIFMPEDYELSFFCGDKNKTYSIEFYNNELVATELDKKYMTNFHLKDIEFDNESGDLIYSSVEDYGKGLERYETIRKNINSLYNEKEIIYKYNITDLMFNKLKYTNSYEKEISDNVPLWKTEFVGGGLTVNSDNVDFENVFTEKKKDYLYRTRDDKKTLFSQHTALYDLDKMNLTLRIQEEQTEYNFNNLIGVENE